MIKDSIFDEFMMEKPDDILNIGKLIDMKWKLGIAVTSDTCKNLSSPFVTMTIKVANASGQVTSHSFEMTVSQFQDFSKQMREMATVMETV